MKGILSAIIVITSVLGTTVVAQASHSDWQKPFWDQQQRSLP